MSLNPLNEDLDIIQNLVIPFLEDDLDIVQKLDDEPNDVGGLTAAELKAKFDEAGNIIKEFLNKTLLPQLSDTVAEAENREKAEAARILAEQGRKLAEEGRVLAEQGRVTEEEARVLAEQARKLAEEARVLAEQARAKAESERQTAESGRISAEEARVLAEQARADENTGIVAQATTKAKEAADSAAKAQKHEENATLRENNAYIHSVAAGVARDNAKTSETNAKTSETNAKTSETNAKTSEGKAKTSEDNAKDSETKAKTSETNAKTSETNAANSESAAKTSEERAKTSEEAAKTSETNAKTSEDNARTSETNAKTSEDNAKASEEEARRLSETFDADKLNARIDGKGDNLEFDTETSLLWLTSGGERIGDGIKVATSGGGGGGGESNNAELTLKNTSGWIYKSISTGASCPISFQWSSLEDGMETGSGVLKITVAGTVKHQSQIPQGEKTIDVGPWLAAGSSAVRVNITDVYGNSRSLNYNVTVVELSLTSSFDATVAYSGDIAFPYVPTAAVEKKVYFLVDGNEIGTAVVATSGRQQTFTIPAQSHGSHTLEVWFEAVIDGETVPSNHLRYVLICIEAGNTRPILAVDWTEKTVEQFDTLSIPYLVYDPASLTAKVSLGSSETETADERTVDRTPQTWNYRVNTAGTVSLTLTCIGADISTGTAPTAVVTIDLTVQEATIDVEPETNDQSLYLTAYGRSNSEADPSQWSYGDVEAELTGFNFTSDGWLQDPDGITMLRVGGDARVEIPVQMFAQDFRTTGKTIEIEFASREVLDYDAIIATCWSGDRGFQITAQQALLKSEKSEVFTRYKEDDHLRLSFVIEKKSGNRLILAYINGIISGMVQYPDSDDFSQTAPVTVTLGSNDCTLDVYNIRIYENDLTRFQMLDNWIADTQNLAEKKDRYDRNNIFDDYGQILPTTLRPTQKYLILNCPVLPTFKGDKKTCSGSYVDPVDTKGSFTFTGAEIDVQGTSSQYYYVKNFKIKFKDGFVQNGKTVSAYAMNDMAIPTNEFTFKADVASSEGANNVVLAELYNDLCPVKTPAQEEDPRVRQTIEGHPIVVFHDAGSGPKFIGKYNFNNDKGTPEVFGFTAGDESWEIKENGNALVSFKTDDFTNWETSFEARYPEDNKNITRLQQFVAWVASTNTEGQTEEEAAARREKFKTELSQWANVEDAIFYYLFTLIFLCIDQREKNAFPTWNAEMAEWLWLFYDADSSLGTDNKGNLTFEYWMEDIDYTAAGDPVYNGQNNVFWTNLRECFADEIEAEYKRLRTSLREDGRPLLSYEVVNDLFEAHQSQWSEAIYNEDAWRKAVEPLEKVNDPQYLPMQQGKKEQHFKHFMYNRFRYLDSKFETGTAMNDENRIMMRAHAQGNIWLTSYINMYGQVYYNSQKAEHRMVRDQETEFEWTAVGAEDAVIGVNSAQMITSLGDLSPLKLEYCHIQYAPHLTELKVGDGGDYRNDNLTAITLGNNTLLRKLDVRNCVSLTQAVDASGCTNIEYVWFEGSSVTSVALPNGGNLKSLHLPGTVTDLTLRNTTKLTDFQMEGYSKITTLRLENVPSVVDGWTILQSIPANSRVRYIGFDWTQESPEAVLALYDYLDTMRGLDEQGNNVDTPQMQGVIHIEALNGEQLAEMKRRYPSITIDYQSIVSNLYFYDETGETLLYTQRVEDGGDGAYPLEAPTKASTVQWVYTFAGWSGTPGGAAQENALKAVTSDRKVYAAFTATLQTYSISWYNGSTLLENDPAVPYGTIPTYDGPTPAYQGETPEDYEFAGWEPTVAAVTGNAGYTAKFTYIGARLGHAKLGQMIL